MGEAIRRSPLPVSLRPTRKKMPPTANSISTRPVCWIISTTSGTRSAILLISCSNNIRANEVLLCLLRRRNTLRRRYFRSSPHLPHLPIGNTHKPHHPRGLSPAQYAGTYRDQIALSHALLNCDVEIRECCP